MRVPLWAPATLIVVALIAGGFCMFWRSRRLQEREVARKQLAETRLRIDQLERV